MTVILKPADRAALQALYEACVAFDETGPNLESAAAAARGLFRHTAATLVGADAAEELHERLTDTCDSFTDCLAYVLDVPQCHVAFIPGGDGGKKLIAVFARRPDAQDWVQDSEEGGWIELADYISANRKQ